MKDDGVLVIDIPITMSPVEAAQVLSEPTTRGYYVRGITTGDPMRVVFLPYASDRDKCNEELRAIDTAFAYKRETATRIVQELCKLSIYRSTAWVKKTMEDLS